MFPGKFELCDNPKCATCGECRTGSAFAAAPAAEKSPTCKSWCAGVFDMFPGDYATCDNPRCAGCSECAAKGSAAEAAEAYAAAEEAAPEPAAKPAAQTGSDSCRGWCAGVFDMFPGDYATCDNPKCSTCNECATKHWSVGPKADAPAEASPAEAPAFNADDLDGLNASERVRQPVESAAHTV